MTRRVAFYWENFGPTHVDRCDAVAASTGAMFEVVGIEFSARSETYDWTTETGASFRKVTVFSDHSRRNPVRETLALLKVCRAVDAEAFFLCHYEAPVVFVTAIVLRCLGKRVFVMNDSKFDDRPRRLRTELLKWFMHLPYQGGIAGSDRTAQYMRFLGLRPDKVVLGYDTISVARIRQLAGSAPAPDGVPFEERHFIVVARLVPKKNLLLVIRAYDQYRRGQQSPRRLLICGSGELEGELRAAVAVLHLEGLVEFTGFVQTDGICRHLARSLALLLVSTEEQFGFAILEALTLGVPVIVSDRCGARDNFVRSGVNGFVVEPDNAEGLAFFMDLISRDRRLWISMAIAAAEAAGKADARQFAASVVTLAA